MILVDLAIGLMTMMMCLILQVTFTFWSVRRVMGTPRRPRRSSGLIEGIVALLVAMLIMMLGNFLQIMLWGALFFVLGEFPVFYEAVYHSGVNFTSLGYGDVVMSTDRKLLGPLEALNGILMLGLSSAALVAILQHLTRMHVEGRSPDV
ncbi:ion channel [Accumulibacter sp.]|uniref:ion channel n=1 Tax=Accumulibacter sp. TaxID=2053492 RepID=UPI0025E4943E|nr:ion channel [Accumulibacter sp.]MCM8613807.1 potassium channel family protein [Accumulibacter sp.]MCM8637473.1 potassium channel family protein [Accumulibacter sp.]MCM8638440.1 potassium channel family protein [Accumulibacter sp.]